MNKVETGEIVVYQPDEITRLEVRVEGETVWLTQLQMAELFGRDRTVITKHIRNIFTEQELDEESNVQILHFANSDKPVKLFSLDVIISVGYRVKSIQGTRFRQWANSVIKEYLVRGYSVSQRLISIERRLDDHEKKIDFFVRTSLPPVEGVFYDGQIFDAYVFVSDLIKSGSCRVVLVDNYVDESVLVLLSKRGDGVSAEIRTGRMPQQFLLDLERHNSQYPPVAVVQTQNIHDRFLIVDDDAINERCPAHEPDIFYLMKLVITGFSLTGSGMPAARPASIHLSSHAILRPSSRMTCIPSSS